MKLETLLNNRLMMLFMTISFFEPSGIEGMSTYIGGIWRIIHFAFSYTKYISFVLILLLALYQMKKMSIIVCSFVAFEIYIILIGFFTNTMSIGELSTAITSIGCALIFDYYLRGANVNKFLDVIDKLLLLIILINFMSIVIFPRGMYIDDRNWWQNYILGFKNRHIYTFLPCLFVRISEDYLRNYEISIRTFCVMGVIFASTIIADSTTSMIAVGLFVVTGSMLRNSKILSKFNILFFYILSVTISVLIIVFRIQNRFSHILGLLNKNVTLTNRTRIWEAALLDVNLNPFIGNGLISYDHLFETWEVSQMHNMYLDVMVIGGLILFGILTFIFVLISREQKKCNVLEVHNIILFLFGIYFVLFITEARRSIDSLIICSLIAFYLPKIIRNCEIDKMISKSKKTFKGKIYIKKWRL